MVTMNKKELELYYLSEIGIGRDEFMKKLAEIQKMVNAKVPADVILYKVQQLTTSMKPISSNPNDMIRE